MITDPVPLTGSYRRRGITYWAGNRTWRYFGAEPLDVRHVRDARGVVWEWRGGFWARHRDDDQTQLTWRCLLTMFGPLTEIVRVVSVPDRAA